MNKCDLLIFGATRNTGLRLVEQAHKHGYSIAAMVRPESDRAALEALNVQIIEGDAFSKADCLNAFTLCQPKSVISTLGGKNKEGKRIDSIGNINVIQAALSYPQPLNRFILMTSMGCGDQYEHISEQARTFLGEALRAKTEAENLLQASPLLWTIARPGGLNHDAPTGKFKLSTKPDPKESAYLSRSDVATALLQLLEDKQYLRQIVTIQ